MPIPQKRILIFCLLFSFFFIHEIKLKAQNTKTIKAGSFIVDMGILPQTVGNGLKPYGLIYDLMKNFQVPILWSINPTKAKDGIDFSIGVRNFSGGPFIIEADFRTDSVNAHIAYWQTQGVVGITTTAPLTVPVSTILYKAPNWTLDKQNGLVAIPYFNNAGIPSTAYGGATSATWKNPADLNACDDLFVMPHADPAWATHGHLLEWNQTAKGGIWLGCSAGSHLEDMFNTAITSQQTNFLSEKTSLATGAGPYSQNALMLAANHTSGVAPYTYDPSLQYDPIMQFMGIFDGAVASGAETVYIPLTPGWRATTKIGVYDADHKQKIDTATKHRAAIIAWGPGLGSSSNGKVFIQASHSFNGTGPTNVAAQRVFFNFSFTAAMGVVGKEVIPSITGLPAGTVLFSGQSLNLSLALPSGVDLVRDGYTVKWSSSGGGSFSPNNTSQNVSFTAPSNLGIAQLSVTLTDGCGRTTFDSKPVDIQCLMNVSPVVTDPCNATPNAGAINLNVTNGAGPFVWKYKKTGAVDSVAGTGTSITGLSDGTYGFTVKGSNGTGCVSTFNTTLTALPAFSVAAGTTNNLSANGAADGTANITVSGGNPTYTYLWNNGVTTQNLSGAAAGTYSVTITDSKGCKATLANAITLTEPPAISITPTVSNVSCNGNSTGAITVAVSGGTSPYTFAWNDGISTQNRTGLKAGTYTLTLTDANGAKKITAITVTEPSALNVSTTSTNITCNGLTNGAIDITVSGGTSSYTYAWSKVESGTYSASSEDLTGLSAGTYNLSVTDAKGCNNIVTSNIVEPSRLLLSAVINKASCPGVNDGSVVLTLSGGNGGYTYAWTGPIGFSSNLASPSGLGAGTYSVTVTDSKSCTLTNSIIIANTNPNPVAPGVINH